MALKGSFIRQLAILPTGQQGYVFTFVLQNTDWMGSQTVNLLFSDAAGNLSSSYQVEVRHGTSVYLGEQNTGWQWCQGDYAAVTDKSGKVKERWQLLLPVYKSGACPECHGTHKCASCNGRGTWKDTRQNRVFCPVCLGTGVCQTCYIPLRGLPRQMPSKVPQGLAIQHNSPQGLSYNPRVKYRPTAVIQGEINRTERELDRLRREYNKRVDPPATAAIYSPWPYSGRVEIKPKGDFGSYTYFLASQIAKAESKLRELYDELGQAGSNY